MSYKPLYTAEFFKELMSQINSLENKKRAHRRSEGRHSQKTYEPSPISARAARVLLKRRQNKV